MSWRSLQIWLVILMLFCLVLVQGYQVFRDFQAQNECKTVLENSRGVISAQMATYLDLLENYKKAAYDNTRVDRIAEQQLLATESQLSALQAMASQNGVLIELASACK